MYCTLDDIKRLLRVLENAGDTQYKIRLSSSHDLPQAYSGNTGTGVLIDVEISSDYAGGEFWKAKFTSGTAFTLYRGEDENSPDGSGTISSNFISTSGIVTISTAQWSGTPITGDQFKFRTTSNMSDDDAEYFIEDADDMINGLLTKFISSTYVPFTGVVPNLIKKASMYYASNLIFSSIFSTLNTEQIPTIIRGWFNFGKNLINIYLETIGGANIFKYSTYARYVSRKPLFDKIGVSEAAGVLGLYGEIDVQNVEYDEDFNSKEQIGSS